MKRLMISVLLLLTISMAACSNPQAALSEGLSNQEMANALGQDRTESLRILGLTEEDITLFTDAGERYSVNGGIELYDVAFQKILNY